MVWIITIVLMSIDICIVFMDPLERQYDLTQVVIAWYLVTLLLDFFFRHNKIYGVIRNIIATVLLNPEKPDVPLNKNDAFQKVQKRRVQEKR